MDYTEEQKAAAMAAGMTVEEYVAKQAAETQPAGEAAPVAAEPTDATPAEEAPATDAPAAM